MKIPTEPIGSIASAPVRDESEDFYLQYASEKDKRHVLQIVEQSMKSGIAYPLA
jgi:hypothetical protein